MCIYLWMDVNLYFFIKLVTNVLHTLVFVSSELQKNYFFFYFFSILVIETFFFLNIRISFLDTSVLNDHSFFPHFIGMDLAWYLKACREIVVSTIISFIILSNFSERMEYNFLKGWNESTIYKKISVYLGTKLNPIIKSETQHCSHHHTYWIFQNKAHNFKSI